MLERDPVPLTEEALENISAGVGVTTAVTVALTKLGQSTLNCSCEMCYLGTRDNI